MADDRVLVITGASTGIGAATARAAVADGFSVVLAARSEEKLDALAGEFGDDRALAVATDVTVWEDNERLIEAAIGPLRPRRRGLRQRRLRRRARLAEGDARSTGARWCSPTSSAPPTRCAPRSRAVKETKGHLLVTGSVAGRRALPGSLYSCTKWAVTAMGEAVRADLNETGVRVTVVEPGMVDTPFFDNGAGPGALQPEDVARAVMYAISQPPHVDVNEILIRPTAQGS